MVQHFFNMKNILIIILLANFVFAQKKLSNSSETIDEIISAQTRARWIGCMLLCRAKLSQHSGEIHKLLFETKHDPDLTQKRIMADILINCIETLTLRETEEIITDRDLNLEKPHLKPIVTINKAQYLDEDFDVNLTLKQLQILDSILKEANSPPEEFPISPSISESSEIPFQIESESILHPALYYPGLTIGIILLIALFILSKFYLVIKKAAFPNVNLKNRKNQKLKKF